jgi:hypothetical protein
MALPVLPPFSAAVRRRSRSLVAASIDRSARSSIAKVMCSYSRT